MSLQDLGSLGEFVSAIAVLVTLIYLAVQTRQTRKAAEQSAYFSQLQANVSTVDMYSRWRGYLQDQGLIDIIEQANSNQPLNEGQQVRLRAAFEELFAAATGAHLNSTRPGSLYDAEADIDYLASVFDQIPCAAAEWRRFKPMAAKVSAELVQAVDAYLEKGTHDTRPSSFACRARGPIWTACGAKPTRTFNWIGLERPDQERAFGTERSRTSERRSGLLVPTIRQKAS